MEQWEIDRRVELELEVPNNMYMIKEDNFSMMISKSGYIEFQITMEKKVKNMFKK